MRMRVIAVAVLATVAATAWLAAAGPLSAGSAVGSSGAAVPQGFQSNAAYATSGVTQAPRRRDAGRAGAHDQHVHERWHRGGRREGGRRRHRGGANEECAAAETRHG